MKKVSIIVPVYNAEKSIGRCVESILNQDYENIELIVVNDGSKDNSRQILDEYASKDPRMIVIHKPNSGVSDTRNTALAKVSGDYIQFLDADDYIPVDSTKSMVRAMEDRDVDLVVGNFYRVIGDVLAAKGSIVSDQVLSRNEYAELMASSPADYYYGVLWNKLYKADIIKTNNLIMDSSISFCEDFIFNLEYLLRCKTVYPLQIPVYYYIKTEGSLVAQNISISKIYNAKISVFKYYDSFFKEILSEKEYAKDSLLIARYLLAFAQDEIISPLALNRHKVGDEYISTYKKEEDSLDAVATAYYFSKIHERYLNTVALRYDLDLRDVKILEMILRFREIDINKEIVTYTGISMPLIIISLEKLAARGFIRFSHSDLNIHVSIATEAGDIIRDLEMLRNDISDIATRNMDVNEKEGALKLLKKMTENIKEFLK